MRFSVNHVVFLKKKLHILVLRFYIFRVRFIFFKSIASVVTYIYNLYIFLSYYSHYNVCVLMYKHIY